MRTYYIKVSGWAHTMLQTGTSVRDARHGMRRLPAGTTCHPYEPERRA
jgi:hypothetical protein